MVEEYTPTAQDLADLDEFIEMESSIRPAKREQYEITTDQGRVTVSTEQFITAIRLAVVSGMPGYREATRHDVLKYVTERLDCEKDLKRLFEFSDMDYMRLCNGVECPYLEMAWDRLFHPTVMEEFERDYQRHLEDQRRRAKRAMARGSNVASQETQRKKEKKTTREEKPTEIQKVIPELDDVIRKRIAPIVKAHQQVHRVSGIIKTTLWLYYIREVYRGEPVTMRELFEDMHRFEVKPCHIDTFFELNTYFVLIEPRLDDTEYLSRKLEKLRNLLKLDVVLE